jgi:hypothetical protein
LYGGGFLAQLSKVISWLQKLQAAANRMTICGAWRYLRSAFIYVLTHPRTELQLCNVQMDQRQAARVSII